MVISHLTIEDFLLGDAVSIPNNPRLPLLVYRSAGTPDPHLAAHFEKLFSKNGWEPAWRHTIYDYAHYHSTAHEVIGIYRGRAEVLFGHTNGVRLRVEAGDVVLIPAGVGHQRLEGSRDFHGVGAYPKGQEPDLMKPGIRERPAADERIEKVPMPKSDPVLGGPLAPHWKQTAERGHKRGRA